MRSLHPHPSPRPARCRPTRPNSSPARHAPASWRAAGRRHRAHLAPDPARRRGIQARPRQRQRDLNHTRFEIPSPLLARRSFREGGGRRVRVGVMLPTAASILPGYLQARRISAPRATTCGDAVPGAEICGRRPYIFFYEKAPSFQACGAPQPGGRKHSLCLSAATRSRANGWVSVCRRCKDTSAWREGDATARNRSFAA